MRMVFGLLGLVMVLAIVGLLAKSQLRSVGAVASIGAGSASAPVPTGTPVQASQQLQKQVQDDVNRLMQQAPARAEPAQ
jgi:hypothetical protein